MAYPFPYIKIKVYPKTFLKDVRLGFLFEEATISNALQHRMGEFFEREFGLANVEMEEMPKAVSVFSNDQKIRFAFGLSRCELSIKREAYRSFEEISPLLSKIYAFIGALGRDRVIRLSFSKYNELGYEADEERAVADVMEGIFSADLMARMTKQDRRAQKDLSRWEKIVRVKGNDATNSIFTIEYGFTRKSEGAVESSLTLKTLIESQCGNIALLDVPKVLIDYNQVLDNAFHWCVSDQVLKAMSKKD